MLAYLDSKIATMLKNRRFACWTTGRGHQRPLSKEDFEGLRNALERWGRDHRGMGLPCCSKEMELRRLGLIAPEASVRLRVDVDGTEEVEE